MGHRLLKIVCLSLLAIALASTLPAQVTNATLNGIVTDSGGVTIPGAKVSVIDLGTNLRRGTTTDSAGAYTLPGLAPGDYRLEVGQAGFKSSVLPNITLDVAQMASVNVILQIGQVSESITVQDVAPLLNTDNATIGSVISEQRILDMPLNGRNFMQLTLLTGGIDEGSSSSNQKSGHIKQRLRPSGGRRTSSGE